LGGTSIGVSWSDGVSINVNAGIEAFSKGVDANISVTAGHWNWLDISGKVGGHWDDKKMGLGAYIGMLDTGIFGYSGYTDSNGWDYYNELGVKAPIVPVVALVAAIAALLYYGAAALPAVLGAGAVTLLTTMLPGLFTVASASNCLE
jgi:hypothetical protein